MLCYLRGRFKKDFNLKKDKLYHTDIAAVGDYIQFNLNKDNTGFITDIDKRKNYLSRKAPRMKGAGYRGERLEQIIAANIDNIFIISSVKQPGFNNRVIDRFLVAAESSGLKPSIVINKIDLDDDSESDHWKKLYSGIGYPVFLTCAKKGDGIEEIHKHLRTRKSVFLGQSGVGKSSILNALFPELGFKVGRISAISGKGTHKTITSIMVKVGEDTFIIDTPGVREMDPFGIRKEDLGHYFAEFTEYINKCRFNTCTHNHEPGCAITEALETGRISAERYDSYLRILNTIEEGIIF